jgi:Dual specificity phosphatase, catalytic domain
MPCSFIFSRCAAIDGRKGNVLIRGNMPLTGTDKHFAFKEIMVASKVTDLATRKFIDVCVIDNVGERSSFEAEVRSFGIDPNDFPPTYWPPYLQADYDPKTFLGTELKTAEGPIVNASMVWWPFEGLADGQDPEVFLSSPGWNFSGLIDYIWELMNTMTDTAIYVHCMLGADRTGAFHIGYLMKTQGLSLKDAMAKANPSTSAGAPNSDYLNLVAAYAKTV